MQTVHFSQLIPTATQPRQYFGEAALQELADSMRVSGFLPTGALQVAPAPDGRLRILAGHRRYHAARLAGIAEVPVVVHEGLTAVQEREIILLDNMNRQDFLPWEEGAGFAELVAGGLSVAAVASKAGKSADYVAKRISLHKHAGEAARAAFLRKEVGLEVLMLIADLPDRDLAPVECPRCEVVNPDGAASCGACGADLAGTFRWPAGNPQATAVKLCRGKQLWQAQDLLEQVRSSYGLSSKPVQASLGLDADRIPEGAIRARSALEKALEGIARQLERLVEHPENLQGLDASAREAAASHAEAGIAALAYIARQLRA